MAERNYSTIWSFLIIFDFVLLSMNDSIMILPVLAKPDISFYSVPKTSIVVKNVLKTHQCTTLLQWEAYSFIKINMGTAVYFGLIPHTPSCCLSIHS